MRTFGSPPRYYQGPGVFDRLGELVAPLGTHPLIVIDAFMLEVLGERLQASLSKAGVSAQIRPFAGEITYAAVDQLIATLEGAAPSAVIGIGGGKALDAAKATALKLRAPAVTAPTAASNDSPTSASIAMYDDNHVMVSVDRLPRNPEVVVVDTALIAEAPARFLRAGIGDAIAKKFEAEGCWNGSGRTSFGTRPLRTAIVIANACYDTLRTHAAAALAAAERSEPDEAFEAVVEANLLMAGLGFENGGLSIAHSMTRGLVKARGAKEAMHGNQVAYGVLAQLAVEGRGEEELKDLAGFLRGIGLPCSLADLGMTDPTEEEMREIARWTMTAPHLANLAVPVSEVGVLAAIRRVERMSVAH